MNRIKSKLKDTNIRVVFPYIAFIAVFLIFAVTQPGRFLTITNMKTIAQQSAVMAIVAFGLLFVIVQGSIDLSIGAVMGFAGIVCADLAQVSVPLAIVAGISIGAAVGLINGLIYTYLKIPSMITTIGMQMILGGYTVIYSHSNSIPFSREMKTIGKYPRILIILAVVFIICFVLLKFTVFGRYCIAIGGDKRVCQLNGIPTKKINITGFLVSGILAAIGGIIMGCRLGAAVPTTGVGYEFECITAVSLGGASLAGGVGSIFNTLVGAMIISMLSNGLVIMGVESEMQEVCTGIVLILAVCISLDRERAGTIK